MEYTENIRNLIEVLEETIQIFEKSGEEYIEELKPVEGRDIYDLFQSKFKPFMYADEGYAKFSIPVSSTVNLKFNFVSWGEEIENGPIRSLSSAYRFLNLTDLKSRLEDLKVMVGELNFINLTPHEINVYNEFGLIARYESKGSARVNTNEVTVSEIDGIEVKKTEYLDVVGLPDPQPNTYYIVSLLVLQAMKGKRNDLIAPNTSPKSVVRDADGKICGVTSFTTI